MEKLTREEIEKMTPEQLRLAVAERVMGWQWFDGVGDTRYLRKPENFTYGAVDAPGNEIIVFNVLPNYPEDIAAAWLVLEEIKKTPKDVGYIGAHIRFTLTESNNGSACSIGLWGMTYSVKKQKSMSIAICRAALIAVSA